MKKALYFAKMFLISANIVTVVVIVETILRFANAKRHRLSLAVVVILVVKLTFGTPVKKRLGLRYFSIFWTMPTQIIARPLI